MNRYETHEGLKQSVEWMRSRPESIKKLMLRFPPSCYVKANRILHIPGPGVVGQIASYFEPTKDAPEGKVSVVAADMFGVVIRAQCQIEWLFVVNYHKNEVTGEIQDSEWVERILQGREKCQQEKTKSV